MVNSTRHPSWAGTNPNASLFKARGSSTLSKITSASGLAWRNLTSASTLRRCRSASGASSSKSPTFSASAAISAWTSLTALTQ